MTAMALGLVTAAQKMGKPLFYGTYPITPASDILHALAPLRNFDVRTFQAEDEIAAMGSIIGAAFGGALAVTGTSGPGVALKSEGMNLAIALELPMVIVNVQRGGPSTGLPTKVEQSDLLQAMFGRNGESPIAVLAPNSPADCFDIAIEACPAGGALHDAGHDPVRRLPGQQLRAVAHSQPGRYPPIPWCIPDGRDSATATSRSCPTCATTRRWPVPWAIPGTAGLEHRIGGLSKAPVTGNVSYNPLHHERMVRDRADKVARLAEVIPRTGGVRAGRGSCCW
jgi:2-oxoglutarate ferredoxin oxidoreductase subunit alpha